MTRTAPVLVAALLVVGTLAAFPVAGLAAQTTDTATEGTATESTETATEQANESENASVPPGAQLSGVVGVGEAELEGDVESRAYGIQVAQAKTNDSKADVVAERLNATEKRLEELEDRKEELDEARANGSMSEGTYRAKVAAVHARTQSVERLANQTNETAQGLPADLLEQKGINATAIQTLKDRASELSGPETAAVARTIAGENAGQGNGPQMAGERGPGQGNDNASDARPGNGANQSQGDGMDSAKDDGPNEVQGNETVTETGGTESGGSGTASDETDGSPGNGDGNGQAGR